MPAQSSQKGNTNEFVEEFAKEILKVKKKKHDDRVNQQKEEQRAKNAVEVAKLKQKFDSYGEIPQKAQEKTEPAIQPAVQKPEAPKPVIVQKPFVANPQMQKRPEPRIKPRNLPITSVPIPPKLPELQPGEIDFGKILFLVRDPLITYIECPGEKRSVIIKRAGLTTRTQINLKSEEIKTIIISFSEKARIPLVEGTLNARVANLEMSAIISETMPPSFILKKIVVDLSPKQITSLTRPMMQFPQPGQQPPRQVPMMPPITRPFSPGQMPPNPGSPQAPQIQQFQGPSLQQPQAPPVQQIPNQQLSAQQAPQNAEKKEGFFNRKIKIGK